ncbi:hypothetical protein FNV43_RR27009 [Rhamnella rubrinervis]|uniref:Uncharacterized protein n=1 Tax=Rhamnella rubrinervis TaxID=2594499 RepID=A0A8K0DR01_9ROSA|nr:hypothetical protein FNV43_RR27009 [Rhamnella rubrinervis]
MGRGSASDSAAAKIKKKPTMETKATDSTAVIRDHTTSSTIDVLSASLRRSSLPQFQLIPRWSHIGDSFKLETETRIKGYYSFSVKALGFFELVLAAAPVLTCVLRLRTDADLASSSGALCQDIGIVEELVQKDRKAIANHLAARGIVVPLAVAAASSDDDRGV